jgi:hypothetical protein
VKAPRDTRDLGSLAAGREWALPWRTIDGDERQLGQQAPAPQSAFGYQQSASQTPDLPQPPEDLRLVVVADL